MQDNYLAELQEKQNEYSKRFTVTKAKIKGISLAAEYKEVGGDDSKQIKADCSAPVHDDLRNAFAAMNSIFADLCEQGPDAKIVTEGFSIGKQDEGAVLIGYRELADGKVLNLTSPFYKYEDQPDLSHAIAVARAEVVLYLFEKKHAPEQQLNLFEGNNAGFDDDEF